MSRTAIRFGAVVKCDVPGCTESFTTYSMASLAREQAEAVGFKRLKMGTLPDWENFGLGSSKRKLLDICQAHVPRARMTGEKAA